jgi:hypothetical protein
MLDHENIPWEYTTYTSCRKDACGVNWLPCGVNWLPCGANWRYVNWLPGGVNWLSCGVNWLPCGVNWLPCGVNWLPCGVTWLPCDVNWLSCGVNWSQGGVNWLPCGVTWLSCDVGLDTDIFNGHGHSQLFIWRTRTCSYEACPQTDTETNTPNFSYQGHGHFTLCVSEYGHGQGHVANYVVLYGHGRVSLFRVRDPRTFTNIYENLRHLHIKTPAFRLPKDNFRSALRLPMSSPTWTRLARRAWFPRAD